MTLGAAGTIVYEGVLDGRPVAVKRLLRQFYDLARKEIQVRGQHVGEKKAVGPSGTGAIMVPASVDFGHHSCPCRSAQADARLMHCPVQSWSTAVQSICMHEREPYHPIATLQVLIVSDEHPNVVRCFAMEEDREFVYLALEKCRCTLSDWVNSAEGKVSDGRPPDTIGSCFDPPGFVQPAGNCSQVLHP